MRFADWPVTISPSHAVLLDSAAPRRPAATATQRSGVQPARPDPATALTPPRHSPALLRTPQYQRHSQVTGSAMCRRRRWTPPLALPRQLLLPTRLRANDRCATLEWPRTRPDPGTESCFAYTAVTTESESPGSASPVCCSPQSQYTRIGYS